MRKKIMKNKKPLLQYLIVDIDENWFSFFSGMLANIPISLLFMFQKWGSTLSAHLFFVLHIITFFLSIALVIIGFLFTILKIQINKTSTKEYESWVKNNGTTSFEIQESILNGTCKKEMPKIRALSAFFLVFAILSLLSIISLWILNSIA